MYNYSDFSDEKLIQLCKENDYSAENEIISRYKKTCIIKADKYYIDGNDFEDIVQEALIGLSNAIRTFSDEYEVKFVTYANVCIERQIYTAITYANRKKHRLLSDAVPIDAIDNSAYYLDNINNTVQNPLNPEYIYMEKEVLNDINKRIEQQLSTMEINVLDLFLQGKNYNEIAKQLKKNEKAIDNAIQRIRRKLKNRLK